MQLRGQTWPALSSSSSSSFSFVNSVQGRYTNRDLTIEENGNPSKEARKSQTRVSLNT